MKKEIRYSDHLERMVGEELRKANINFIHESQGCNVNLDFYLYDYDVYIEIKQFHSDRIAFQIQRVKNVIVLQGINSVKFFIKLLQS